MHRLLPLAFLGLTACGNVCDLIGSYTGTYEGDANGNVTLAITDDKGDTLITVQLAGDLAAGASGTVGCTDGTFDYSLTDADGATVGDISGTVDSTQSASGDFTTTDGGSGTWSATAQ